MDLSLTDRQESLKNAAREFFDAECPTSLVRAMEEDDRGTPPSCGSAWRRWLDGAAVPGAIRRLGRVFDRPRRSAGGIRRALVPGPFFETVAVAGLTILTRRRRMSGRKSCRAWLTARASSHPPFSTSPGGTVRSSWRRGRRAAWTAFR